MAGAMAGDALGRDEECLNVKRNSKKCLFLVMSFLFLLTACGKGDSGITENEIVYEADSMPEVDATPILESVSKSEVRPEGTNDHQENTDLLLQNEFFRVTLKSCDETAVDDGHGTVRDYLTVLFEFKNITDQTF